MFPLSATISDTRPGVPQLSCVKVVRPRRPLIALLEFAAVDPDQEHVAIVTSLGSGFVHHIASGRTKAIPLRPRRRKTCLSATNNLLAACHDTTIDLYRMDHRSGMAELRHILPNSTSSPRVCSLSANGQLFGLVVENTKTASSVVKVFDNSDWDTPLQTWVDKNYDGISFSPDGSTTFLYGEQQLVAFDTVSGSQRAALSIDPGRKHSRFLGFVSDQSTDHVAVVDGTSLQLWNVNCPDEPAKTLPHYRPPISLYSIGACAISRDGGRVVAAVLNHNFGIWDTTTCSRIATMVGHEFRLYACAIASDGNSIVTVADNFEIRTWKMPRDSRAHQIVDDVDQAQSVVDDEDHALTDVSDSMSDLDEPKIRKIATHLQTKEHIEHTQSLIRPALTATVLEHAFAKILSNPALLDHSFITDHISANNVNTASDLLAGHNIILFAIRAGVITHNDIHTIGDSRWYLQDNLYSPATKLTDENGDLLDAIFLHAESLGIVKDGHKFKMAREFRLDMENDLQSIGHAVTDMAQRLCHLEERVDALETDVRNMNEMVNKLASNEQNLQDAVMRLSEALRQLQESLHKGDKRIKYAAVAKCLLSFIPLVGHAVGEASFTVAELLMEFNKRDVRRIRMERMKSIVTQITQVDLSNMQVARYAFSETTQKKLEPPARDAVLDSVQRSGFKSVDEVESALVQLVSEITVKDEPIALLDVGSSAWLSEGSSTTTGDGPSRSDLPEDEAQKYFEYVCANKGVRELEIDDAKMELNQVLDRCTGLHKIDDDSFDDLFYDITDPDVETVNEALFLEIFRRVREDQTQQCAMEAVLEETRERFDKRAGSRAYVNVRLAARLLYNMGCEMVERGMLNERLCTDASAAAQAMSGMGFETGNIGRDEFVTVVEYLLNRDPGEGRSILSCTYDSENIAKIAGNFN